MSYSILLDVLVIVAYFAIILGIGLAQRSRSGSVEGFALGDRQIAWWAVLASILAAEISAGTFFGTPGEGYALRNFTYVQLIFGYVLARIVVSAVFIPAYYRYNVVSIYEFLGHRFGPTTRRVASGVFLITRALASGTRLWVPTILIVIAWKLFVNEQVSGWQEFWLYAGALIVITALTAVYTAVGGIRAVIWTDVIQICVLFCALGFSLWFLLGKIPGGWEGVKDYLTQPGVAKPDDLRVLSVGHPDPDFPGLWGWIKGILEEEYTLWAAFLGSTFVTLATHGTDQDMVQRMLTAKNKNQSALATILSGVVDIPVVLVVLAIGILLWVFYQLHPEAPLIRYDGAGGAQPRASEVFPQFILTQMPHGLRGLVIAGVLATAMGSLSTALNALATSYVRDFHFPLVWRAAGRGRARPGAAPRHGHLRRRPDRHRARHGRSGRAQAIPAHHPDHPRHFRLHLRLAPRRLHGRPLHPQSRHVQGQHHRHDRRIHRRRLPQRARHLDRRPRRRPRLPAPRLDAGHRVPMADFLRNTRHVWRRGQFSQRKGHGRPARGDEPY